MGFSFFYFIYPAYTLVDFKTSYEQKLNKILNDLVASVSPRFMSLKANSNVRGGIYTSVVAEHVKEGWSPEHKSL